MDLTVKMWRWSELLKGLIDEKKKEKKKQLSWLTSLFFRTEDQALSDTLQHPVTAEERLTQAMLELTFNGWFIQEKAHAFHRSLARARVMYSDV